MPEALGALSPPSQRVLPSSSQPIQHPDLLFVPQETRVMEPGWSSKQGRLVFTLVSRGYFLDPQGEVKEHRRE